ncbi:2-amino-4-hydroxy-6-hydroxymethyldihydropteridine pyrophosphokinase [Paenibacillus aceti]|uniref:2-amino-4-hydroxy-6-hydroxymethyldihydropteridine diphosphokinase n=1 Tax=Paenibacillus aceti TaxID=1820010 RepID=A0ABQ1W7S5_9BACL|nr:2-amino-4-hydroxy-6-hydroxymethyldihydropteridine diphosphokinase [Paenibacillus aceti]GGG18129.1 2-amino-4-hydroxy-6-hydroxymethyldihydropteridine pyrophosphokinase [Paenibacillus aceti]
MTIAYIGLGTNLGRRHDNLNTALDYLEKNEEIRITSMSNRYETAPIGNINQPNFINMVCSIETSLTAFELLESLMEIENELGRVREEKWGPRIIDLDILTFGKEKINHPDLIIPHPRLTERLFVLLPLLELDLVSFPYSYDELNRYIVDLNEQKVIRLEQE